MQAWREGPARGYDPRRLLLAIPADAKGLPGMLTERHPRDGVVAYICEGLSCRAPVTDKSEFDNLVKQNR